MPAARPRPPEKEIGPTLLLTLGLLAALAPFATDIYLPTFPEMTAELHSSASGIQLTLTAFFIGAGAGQLVFGPLSDARGRKGPLIIGMGVCAVASLAAAVAPTIATLVAARAVQGFAGSAGVVIGRAVIADLAHGAAAARAFNLMMVVNGIAPVVAPLAGGFLAGPIGWRGILFAVFGFAALTVLAAVVVIPESNPEAKRAERRAARSAAGRTGLTGRAFLANALSFAFAFAGMMAYISASPFLYQSLMGLGEVAYGLAFGLNALALTAVSAVSARLVRRGVAPLRLAGVGLGAMVGAAIALGALVGAGADAGWFALPVCAAVASLGLVFGNATAAALGAVPHAAGRASAVLGALQFGLGGLASPLVGLGGERSAVPLAVVLGSASALALGSHLVGRRRP
jgi:DHA1 family bicyclomycin/chloramphenicol resistance-like MFS transporter